MLWSKSRLSHHITRMERRGLVRREDVASDGRGAFVVLTEDGMRAIEAAAPPHVESVRRHFIDLLTEDEIRALGDIASKVLDHLGAAEDLSPGSD
jgi:DNA-binding MarR family transcriptional regulator